MTLLKKSFIGFVSYLFLSLSVYATSINTPQEEIQNDFNQMAALWNQGDIKTFVTWYKNSDDTAYISTSVIHGYQNILNRYLTHYPTRDDMGTLSMSNLEIKLLSSNYAMVIGNWHLARKNQKNIGGIFTLLLEKTTAGWKIVVDHTS